jgi:hypothetical protein
MQSQSYPLGFTRPIRMAIPPTSNIQQRGPGLRMIPPHVLFLKTWDTVEVVLMER